MCFVLFFLIFYHLFEIMEPFYKYNLYLCSWFGEKSGLTKKHLLLFRVEPKCPGNSLEIKTL